MKFDTLLSLTRDLPWFDLPTIVQSVDEPRSTLVNQLHRWVKSGRLVSLRRGMYAVSDLYRRKTLNPAEVANGIYVPSYLSGLWTMSYFGLLPERVVTYTSVTSRVTRSFSNTLGEFHYSNIKQSAFFGYQSIEMDGVQVCMALPEKAILDHWHLASGKWTESRMMEMRYQNTELIDPEKLSAFADRFESPRLARAARLWNDLDFDDHGVEIE